MLEESEERFEAFALHGAGGTHGSNTTLPVWQVLYSGVGVCVAVSH